MSDELRLRITAGYAATDGSVPESLEIEYTGRLPSADEVGFLVGALGKIGQRYAVPVPAGDYPVRYCGHFLAHPPHLFQRPDHPVFQCPGQRKDDA